MMKRNKIYVFVMVAVLLAFGFMACPTDSPAQCDCNPKEHLGIGETCTCGKGNCNCTLQVYGTVVQKNGNNFKIYRNGTVSDGEMSASATAAVDGYNLMSDGVKDSFNGKIDEVHIVPSSSSNNFEFKLIDGKKCLLVKAGLPATAFRSAYQQVDTGALAL